MNGVAQVHLKCIAVSTKAVFDEECQDLSTVEEVSNSNAVGVCTPVGNGWVLGWQAVDFGSNRLEPAGVFGSKDE